MTPTNAIPMWIADGQIYAAVPKRDGSGHVYFKFPITEGGLSKALALLQTKAKAKRVPKHPAGASATTLSPDEKRSATAFRLLKERGML